MYFSVLLAFSSLLLLSATVGKNLNVASKVAAKANTTSRLGVAVKTNATGEGLPFAYSNDTDFTKKVVALKKQALKLMQLRGKKVDINANVTEDANWDDIALDERLYKSLKKSFDLEEQRLTSKNETDRITAPDFNLIPYAKWPMPINYTTTLIKDTRKFDLIKKALDEIQSKTCIKFEQVDTATGPHIAFKEVQGLGGACANSPLGMLPGGNVVNIGYSCMVAGTYLHEILHSLGFAHTQMRPDAEQFVTINQDNIQEAFKSNFKPWPYALNEQGPYDYGSIMQYNRFAFSINNSKPTVVPKVDPEKNGRLMGQRDGLSEDDAKTINKIYCEDPDPIKSGCVDKQAGCAGFAELGYCDPSSNFADFMKRNCNFSCKVCTRESATTPASL